ncbi:MAG: YggS family pyridoxal phosphate-dependent enzyme [Porticoccaceae bacterium]|nr:YggS family pyridoxal phosphate-dependent enzyme [Porticoccaceae bacterium]
MSTLADRIDIVKQRIKKAAKKAGRDEDEILLLAVTKTQNLTAVNEAIKCGLYSFGENYVQEGIKKIKATENKAINWHFIGPLQANKTKIVATNFDWIHSLDQVKTARRLSDQRPASLSPLNVCIQVNIDNEPTKHGIAAYHLAETVDRIVELPQIKLRGLMAIPAPRITHDCQRKVFRKLVKLREEVNARLDKCQKLDTLSMGMSFDLEAAIKEGATIVRVGTDIFGARHVADSSERL